MVSAGKIHDRISDSDWYVYVLELEDSKYYIGIAEDVEKRFRQHQSQGKNCSGWCKKFKPIRIKEMINSNTKRMKEATLLEDIISLNYIGKYGASNVRGGRYIGSENAILRKSNSHLKNGNISMLHKVYFEYGISLEEIEKNHLYAYVTNFSNKDSIQNILNEAKEKEEGKQFVLKRMVLSVDKL